MASDSKALGNFNKRIERATRPRNRGHSSKRIDHHLPPSFIVSNDGRKVDAETWNHAPLRHAGRAHVGVLLELGNLLHNFLWPRHISKAPTRASIRLAKAADQQAFIAEARRAWTVSILAHVAKAELVVDLIADEQHAAAAAQVNNVAQFRAGEHSAAWITWAANQHRLGARRHAALNALRGHTKVWVGVAAHHGAAGHLSQLRVHHKVRIGNDHLITSV